MPEPGAGGLQRGDGIAEIAEIDDGPGHQADGASCGQLGIVVQRPNVGHAFRAVPCASNIMVWLTIVIDRALRVVFLVILGGLE